MRLLSRFIFAMKISRASRAKTTTTAREHSGTDIRTPHFPRDSRHRKGAY
jgi:hypothetical protein